MKNKLIAIALIVALSVSSITARKAQASTVVPASIVEALLEILGTMGVGYGIWQYNSQSTEGLIEMNKKIIEEDDARKEKYEIQGTLNIENPLACQVLYKNLVDANGSPIVLTPVASKGELWIPSETMVSKLIKNGGWEKILLLSSILTKLNLTTFYGIAKYIREAVTDDESTIAKLLKDILQECNNQMIDASKPGEPVFCGITLPLYPSECEYVVFACEDANNPANGLWVQTYTTEMTSAKLSWDHFIQAQKNRYFRISLNGVYEDKSAYSLSYTTMDECGIQFKYSTFDIIKYESNEVRFPDSTKELTIPNGVFEKVETGAVDVPIQGVIGNDMDKTKAQSILGEQDASKERFDDEALDQSITESAETTIPTTVSTQESLLKRISQWLGLDKVLKSVWEWLFSPDEEEMARSIDELKTSVSDRTGILTYPFTVLYRFGDDIINAGTSDAVLTLPDINYKGNNLCKSQSYNLTQSVEKEPLKQIYDIYLVVIKAMMIFALLNLAHKKYNNIMGVGK